MEILHIVTHMGGGVGRAISDLILNDTEHRHILVLLQSPEKMQFVNMCKKAGIPVIIGIEYPELYKLLNSVDIVIIHWWHHPVMCKFLYELKSEETRMILWCHVSGCTYPYLSYEFTRVFDRIFITSLCSLDNKFWTDEQRKEIAQKMRLVYGLGNVSFPNRVVRDKETKIIKIGYIGTLAKSKIHPQFSEICNSITRKRKSVEFYLIGDVECGKWMRKKFEDLQIEEKVHFLGYVGNVDKWLCEFDIFGYPLNPYHFGTTENVILEAMAAGLPVVAMNQSAEKNIITNGKDGVLCSGIEDYIEKIIELIDDQGKRADIGASAIKTVKEKFNISDNVQRFKKEIDEVMLLSKRKRIFTDILGNSACNWFFSGMNPEDREIFATGQYEKIKDIFKEKSKSSLYHFAECFPEDRELLLYIRNIEKREE